MLRAIQVEAFPFSTQIQVIEQRIADPYSDSAYPRFSRAQAV